MKRLCLREKKSSKRGVASLYVVIFATMVFGIVALSCMRIMLSEVTQSSEDDQSRSAYDAAMAGVEDAKTAVNKYYKCLSGSGTSTDCNQQARDDIFQNNCTNSIGVAKYLYNQIDDASGNTPEILIQEGSTDNNSDQAYTCVIVSDVTPDYRGYLTDDTRTRVIPLGVKSENMNTSSIKDVTNIRFSWFSQLNEGNTVATPFSTSSEGKLPDGEHRVTPPVIQLTLLAAKSPLDISQLHAANNGANYSTVVLVPSDVQAADNGVTNTIAYGELKNAGNNGNGITHVPFTVTCFTSTDFACTVDLQVDFRTDNIDTALLIASLPYGDTIADFSVSMYDGSGNRVKFVGSQISVDSTGRTGQLVRRVETRLEPSDLYFPFPMYALDLGGDGGDSTLEKNFWITDNCWYTRTTSGGFNAGKCDNNNNTKGNNPNP